jgi:hypothetical protein
MNCVILQPSYIPWRGFFHQILKSDVFVFYDDVQYDKHGWRNRNQIKTINGLQWLTIPVHSGGAVENKIPIHSIRIDWKKDWAEKHWTSIQQAYSKAPYFEMYAEEIKGYYTQHDEFLSDFTIETTTALTRLLGINHVKFLRSSDFQDLQGVKTDRLIDLLTRIGCSHYITGPSAKNYLEEEKFDQAGISLEYMAYDYPSYPQLYAPYEPQVSILDLLFMVGPSALSYINGSISR